MSTNVRKRGQYSAVSNGKNSDDVMSIDYKLKEEDGVSKWGARFHSILWLIGTSIIWYYANMFHVLTSDPRIRSWSLYTCILSCVTIACVFVYLMIVSRGKNVDDMLKAYPSHIHTATYAGLIACISFIISIWPIWGWLSLPMTFVTSIALILSANLFPDC